MSSMNKNKAMLVIVPASILTILALVTPVEQASLTDERTNTFDVQTAYSGSTSNILADSSTGIDSPSMHSPDNLIFVKFDTRQELKTISQTFSATAGSSSERKTIMLTSTQFPVIIHAIYIEASLGTGTNVISYEESIKFDEYIVNEVAAIDPGNVSLTNGSNKEAFVRTLLSQDSDVNVEHKFPLTIYNNFELGLLLDSLGEDGASDPDNGFNFTVIVVVMAPENASVELS